MTAKVVDSPTGGQNTGQEKMGAAGADNGEVSAKAAFTPAEILTIIRFLEVTQTSGDQGSDWAAKQIDSLKARLEAAGGASLAENSTTEAPADTTWAASPSNSDTTYTVSAAENVGFASDDEDDDFFDDMEADDDILQSRKLKKERRQGKSSKVSAGATDAAGAGAPQKTSLVLKVVLGLALAAGVLGGIWFAGQPNSVDQQEIPAMASAVSPEQVENRINELVALVEQNPNDANARLELGVLYFNLKDTDAAGEQWLAVTQIDPTEVAAWYNLGFYYLSRTPPDMDKAKEAWQQVVEIAPDSQEAKTAQAHLRGLTEGDMPAEEGAE